MAKIFSFVLVVAVISIAAALVYSAGDIAFIECQDHECQRGCRTIGKIPEDTCHSPPFQHGRSTRAICSQAPPTGMCYYLGVFKKNDTTGGQNYCTDDNAEFLEYQQCNTCRESRHRKGTYEKTTCDSSTDLKLLLGCDKTCTTCEHTHSLEEKKCTVPPTFPSAIEVSAPVKCAQAINYFHYNNSNCNGTAATESAFSGVCYSFMGRSHIYHCS